MHTADCLGTGTPAGDPQEAEAIASAFFGSRKRSSYEEHLYVGSIKTVIGHTEGTAGIAGLLKASLAVQNATIPPNMLFENLSPKVEPFYNDVRILTTARPWPDLVTGAPRRASVNSFGMVKPRRMECAADMGQASGVPTPMPSSKVTMDPKRVQLKLQRTSLR